MKLPRTATVRKSFVSREYRQGQDRAAARCASAIRAPSTSCSPGIVHRHPQKSASRAYRLGQDNAGRLLVQFLQASEGELSSMCATSNTSSELRRQVGLVLQDPDSSTAR